MVYFVAKVVPFVAKGGPVLMAKGGILLMAEIGILYLTIYSSLCHNNHPYDYIRLIFKTNVLYHMYCLIFSHDDIDNAITKLTVKFVLHLFF